MFLSLLSGPLEIHIQRGDLAEARRVFSLFANLEGTSDVQERACFFGASAALGNAEGRHEDALTAGRTALETTQLLRISHQAVEQGIVEALEAAVVIGDHAFVREQLDTIESIPPGLRPPILDAHMHRFRGRVHSDPAALVAAATRFREIGTVFWLAVTLLEHGELTGDSDSLDDAREIFEGLCATPWLERIEALAAAGASTSVPA